MTQGPSLFTSWPVLGFANSTRSKDILRLLAWLPVIRITADDIGQLHTANGMRREIHVEILASE